MKQKAMQFALVRVIETQDLEKVQLLIKDGVNIDATIIYTKTPLTHAIDLNYSKVALHLLENGCNPTLTEDHFPHSQPIHLAARKGMSKIVEKLVDMNSDPNARDQDGMTPLHIASYFGHVDVVEMLIKRRAISDVQDSCGRTPLHRAVESGSDNVVTTLLRHNADINTTDDKGWTPLHLAIALDYPDVVKLLLENKCKLNIQDTNDKTPLTIACDFLSRSNYDIIRATQFHYGARKRDFMQGRYLSLLQCPREDREMLQTVVSLINVGSNINGPGVRPITVASKADHADTVYMLIISGALIPQFWEPMSTDVRQGFKMLQLLEWINSHYMLQFNLLWQCKRKIRKLLAFTRNIENGIDELPLPPSLKTFLK